MHVQPARTLAALLERPQAAGALAQPGVVQRGRVLHQQHGARQQLAAVHHGLPVRRQNVLHGNPLIAQEAVGGLLVLAAREDGRQALARALLPGPAHGLEPLPQAPVRQVRALELARRPVRLLAVEVQPREATQHQPRRLPQHTLPIGHQRLDPDLLGMALRLAEVRLGALRPRGLLGAPRQALRLPQALKARRLVASCPSPLLDAGLHLRHRLLYRRRMGRRGHRMRSRSAVRAIRWRARRCRSSACATSACAA